MTRYKISDDPENLLFDATVEADTFSLSNRVKTQTETYTFETQGTGLNMAILLNMVLARNGTNTTILPAQIIQVDVLNANTLITPTNNSGNVVSSDIANQIAGNGVTYSPETSLLLDLRNISFIPDTNTDTAVNTHTNTEYQPILNIGHTTRKMAQNENLSQVATTQEVMFC